MRTRILYILFLMAALQSCSAPGNSKPVPTNSISPLLATNPAPEIMLTVYFTDMPRYEVGTEPYEAAVTRMIPPPASLLEAVLNQLFRGPSDPEKAQGLAVVLSGTTGFSKLTLNDGVT
jgi:spore germination protein GerM